MIEDDEYREALKDKIAEVLTQLAENTINNEHAKKDLYIISAAAFDDGETKVKDNFSLEDESAQDMINELENRDNLTESEVTDLEILVRNYKGHCALIPENLHDEQKLELVIEAMGKYTLDELEKRLK